MQTFLRSHSGSSRSIGNTVESTAGFTMVELLISIAIITILSAVVIAKFSIFDSTTLLKSMAYEVATNLRETQVFAVSVKGADPDFDYPFGITLPLGSQTYSRFQFSDENARPFYEGPSTITQNFQLTRSISVSELCVKEPGEVEKCDVTRLDISFKRPEFGAIFATTGSTADDLDIQSAKIKLSSPNGNSIWAVVVGIAGDIRVCKDGEVACDL